MPGCVPRTLGMTPRILTPSPCWPEPDIKASCLGLCPETVAGSKLLGCVGVRAATKYTLVLVARVMLILTPVPDIAVHVKQAPIVRLQAGHGPNAAAGVFHIPAI